MRSTELLEQIGVEGRYIERNFETNQLALREADGTIVNGMIPQMLVDQLVDYGFMDLRDLKYRLTEEGLREVHSPNKSLPA